MEQLPETIVNDKPKAVVHRICTPDKLEELTRSGWHLMKIVGTSGYEKCLLALDDETVIATMTKQLAFASKTIEDLEHSQLKLKSEAEIAKRDHDVWQKEHASLVKRRDTEAEKMLAASNSLMRIEADLAKIRKHVGDKVWQEVFAARPQ